MVENMAKEIHIEHWVQAKEGGMLSSKELSPTTLVMV
jgi:hypothetical protein